jgi:hypothetical protein
MEKEKLGGIKDETQFYLTIFITSPPPHTHTHKTKEKENTRCDLTLL